MFTGFVSADADLWAQAAHRVDVRNAFVGHELGDGVHYAYRFRSDGTFSGLAMGTEIHGTRRAAGNESCWRQSKFSALEECFEVERHGKEFRFLRDGYPAFTGKLRLIKTQRPTREPR